MCSNDYQRLHQVSVMTKLMCVAPSTFRAATPYDQEDLKRFKVGDVMEAKVTRVRNPQFHKKMFALFNFAYDHFNPVAVYRGEKVLKNYERFRQDITILAGYGDPVVNLRGDVRMVARSISFASMSEDDFEKLYSNVIDVILSRVLTNYNKDDLDNVIDQLMSYA